jgi:hypothetical protein
MFKAAASKPAGSPGPHTFSKIQENALLFNKNWVLLGMLVSAIGITQEQKQQSAPLHVWLFGL